MKKRIFSLFIVLCLCLGTIVTNVCAYDSVTIYFSNIGNVKNALPPLENSTSVTGLMVNGYPMVKLSDLANIMGATITYSNDFTIWYLERNLQTTVFTKDYASMYTSNGYQYYDPVNGTNDSYSHTWVSSLPVAPQEINSWRYVPLYAAAMQLGALLVEPSNGAYYVYDFRINGTTPISDSNEYIVGGSWITNWSNYSDTHLADHFEIHEMWSSTSYSYARQLKMAVPELESAERVRHYYNSDSSMNLSCAFRSWAYNNALAGSAVNSFHMRGRAWDCPTDALYTSVYNEFRNGQTYPYDDGYWKSRIPSTGYSRGYEIEKMPSGGDTWLHLQRQPGYDTAPENP